ncbi:MAG: cupin domain-containing protein [Clostridiales bacterium]|jgi:quercetin dioxygenase-like cupin family protein|nr:cupin domain-containing protein [Clostridiales bacterium]
MFCFHREIEKKDLGKGVLFQNLGAGKNMNVFHWNMADGSVVELHDHPEEQFGYVIRGGFEIRLNGQKTVIGEGDAYFIPPDAPHSFTAVGETEAIDIFTPVKSVFPA